MTDPGFYELRGVSSGYFNRPVLRGVSFGVRPGEFVGVVGPNGSGKSTLIRTLTGLLKTMDGAISLRGRALTGYPHLEQARQVAVVPQSQAILFAFSVREIVEMGRYPHCGSLNRPGPRDREVVTRALAEADVAHLADRSVDQLSGGELQRVTLARALAQETPGLLLDEPTAHQDLKHQLQVFELLQRRCREHQSCVLCVLHDLNLAAEFCSRILLLSEGRLIADGKPEAVFTPGLLRQVYAVETEVGANPFSGRPTIVLKREPRPGGEV